MRLYLAGPMRGLPEFNFPAFDRAEAQLTDKGHQVFSPAARDRDIGFTAQGLTGHEDLAELGFDLRDALAADLDWVTRHAERVIVLPGWDGSSGARAEVATATALGIPVHELLAFDMYGELAPDVTDRTPSGEERVTSPTGGEKGRKLCEVGAIDPLAREELGKVAGFGARKYARGNYLNGYDWSLCIDAMHRHMLAFEAGEDRDPESGQLHVAHAAWHGLALTSFVLRAIGTDDRTTR